MSAADLLMFVRGLAWTTALTMGSFAIGAILAIPLLAARRSRFFPVRFLASVAIQIVRAIPPILWLFIIFFGLGISLFPISPFVAALAGLGLIAAANMAEIYRGALSSIHHGQWEACAALDLGRWSTMRDVVAPQAFRVALPSGASYLIGLMKETAVASTIGVTELAYQGNQLSQLTFRGLEIFAFVGLFYIFLSLPVAWLSRLADAHLRSRVAR
ncbi:amino acid ABC transporter permease [Rhizobium rhizogenes]|uniref:Amino acid ABC transporter n=1 Tax=Rhizobium rhizogenes (strain K84 / ATCC BAA-868) TaxID=311403 RepID=B9JLE3_RHIR8|nr:amino acid ABC transporter permease [Rhizobium rhizogenes]ACM28642.1 amino acid ABC transporter [Rhizobium rhizogenes K84]OCJ19084.1 amino acid ABC transporter permease [Agrobacterium sp. B131/95]MDJ1638688.1 amino acid ABC transporter permease [Rhizobium rhizogenes]NTG75658.1 amino acid ABC transporter permease [Rhizobium rhizogenes]NTG88417.1 amino acid ABC transporter permease [Rhizobium rhizogenes]